MSNVIDNETNRPLGEGIVTHIISHKGKKVKLFFIEFLINFLINSIIIWQIGLIGLIEEEWLATLATLALDDVTYLDFVSEGKKLAKFLKEKVILIVNN